LELNFVLVFLHVQNDAEAALFESQLPTIVALTKGCKSAKAVRSLSEIPEGCGAEVVTSSVTLHTLVRGLVDLDVEIGKCDKKLNLAKMNLAKIVKVESQPDYLQTVPENVRLANEDKVRHFPL
jgi:valyl-tRNA synthetase